jgi:hypothetical protein
MGCDIGLEATAAAVRRCCVVNAKLGMPELLFEALWLANGKRVATSLILYAALPPCQSLLDLFRVAHRGMQSNGDTVLLKDSIRNCP